VDNKCVAAHRLDGLLDARRPVTRRAMDDVRVDAVIAKTLNSVPHSDLDRLAERWFALSFNRAAAEQQSTRKPAF
jgi:hypothetical protein